MQSHNSIIIQTCTQIQTSRLEDILNAVEICENWNSYFLERYDEVCMEVDAIKNSEEASNHYKTTDILNQHLKEIKNAQSRHIRNINRLLAGTRRSYNAYIEIQRKLADIQKPFDFYLNTPYNPTEYMLENSKYNIPKSFIDFESEADELGYFFKEGTDDYLDDVDQLSLSNRHHIIYDYINHQWYLMYSDDLDTLISINDHALLFKSAELLITLLSIIKKREDLEQLMQDNLFKATLVNQADNFFHDIADAYEAIKSNESQLSESEINSWQELSNIIESINKQDIYLVKLTSYNEDLQKSIEMKQQELEDYVEKFKNKVRKIDFKLCELDDKRSEEGTIKFNIHEWKELTDNNFEVMRNDIESNLNHFAKPIELDDFIDATDKTLSFLKKQLSLLRNKLKIQILLSIMQLTSKNSFEEFYSETFYSHFLSFEEWALDIFSDQHVDYLSQMLQDLGEQGYEIFLEDCQYFLKLEKEVRKFWINYVIENFYQTFQEFHTQKAFHLETLDSIRSLIEENISALSPLCENIELRKVAIEDNINYLEAYEQFNEKIEQVDNKHCDIIMDIAERLPGFPIDVAYHDFSIINLHSTSESSTEEFLFTI